jgi:hypothetical protein
MQQWNELIVPTYDIDDYMTQQIIINPQYVYEHDSLPVSLSLHFHNIFAMRLPQFTLRYLILCK